MKAERWGPKRIVKINRGKQKIKKWFPPLTQLQQTKFSWKNPPFSVIILTDIMYILVLLCHQISTSYRQAVYSASSSNGNRRLPASSRNRNPVCCQKTKSQRLTKQTETTWVSTSQCNCTCYVLSPKILKKIWLRYINWCSWIRLSLLKKLWNRFIWVSRNCSSRHSCHRKQQWRDQ